jgi:hypothetical protein
MLFAALVLLTLNLRAALQFDVSLGLDSHVREGCWFPITCEILNDGPAFEAVIEVAGGGLGQGGLTRLVPVELPTGTRKRITIPVFRGNAYNENWDVRLKDSTGRKRGESLQPRLLPVSRNTVLLGSLARNAGWTPAFQKILANNATFEPAAARLQAQSFPDNALVLEGMDALYLNSERAADLRVQQVAALDSWLNAGGHLIVGIEAVSDINNAAWLRRLMPLDLAGTRVLTPGTDLEDWLRSPVPRSMVEAVPAPTQPQSKGQSKTNNVTLQAPFSNVGTDARFDAAELTVATGTLHDGKVLVAAGDTPLVVTRRVGHGRVTALLFSPEREPVKSWRNQPAFWSRLTEVPSRWYVSNESYYNNGSGVDGIFGAMIDSRQVRKLPIHWLLLLLLAYLAIIGPVDQVWLRKLGKPMLTWITFPCYVALFSGLIYLVGYKLRAGESEWNELHVVDVFPSGQRTELRGHSFGSIYSPVNQQYQFQSAASAAAFRGESSGGYGSQSGDQRGRVVQSENSFKADVFVPVWTSQLYVSDWLQTAEAPFFASVENSTGGWKATVQNRLDKPLTHACLVLNGQLFELGQVPARQTRSFTRASSGNNMPLGNFVSQHGASFQNAVQQRRSAFGAMEGGRLDDLPNSCMAASFLAHLNGQGANNAFVAPPSFDLSRAADAGSAILLAWSDDQSPAKPLNQFSPRRKTVNTLWRLTLPMNHE